MTSSRIPTCTINPTPKGSNSLLGTSRIAQSQPGSRSTSPASKYSYLTHTNNNIGVQLTPLMNNSPYNNNNNNNSVVSNDLASTPNSYSNGTSKLNGVSTSGGRNMSISSATKSKIPTSSRNSSRESSPGRRSNYGSERRTSITKNARRGLYGRQLTNGSDSEQVLATAMSNKYVKKIYIYLLMFCLIFISEI